MADLPAIELSEQIYIGNECAKLGLVALQKTNCILPTDGDFGFKAAI